MLRSSEILGMNARNILYTRQNRGSAKRICHSKLLTKQLMMAEEIGVARILALINSHEELQEFAWERLGGDFAIKPSNGAGGKGILVIEKKLKKGGYVDTMGGKWSQEELYLHCSDILEGKYTSHPGAQTMVIIEERVAVHPKFAGLAYHGTPDVRVIVYNSIPVMAMLRLPTRESEGRANLHQGAVGVGIDLNSGLTIKGIRADGSEIREIAETGEKLAGFQLPYWRRTLLTAVRAVRAAKLSYGGVDLFIDKAKGPMVVELNTSPGLNIQLANNQGLKRRLERVSDLEVLEPEHGIKIAQALFASPLVLQFQQLDVKAPISFRETGEVIGSEESKKVGFIVDTGRARSSISRDLALELGLCEPEDLLWFQRTETGEKAPVVEVTFVLAGKKVTTAMIVSRALDKAKNKVRLGRRDLTNFIIQSSLD